MIIVNIHEMKRLYRHFVLLTVTFLPFKCICSVGGGAGGIQFSVFVFGICQ